MDRLAKLHCLCMVPCNEASVPAIKLDPDQDKVAAEDEETNDIFSVHKYPNNQHQIIFW